MTKKHFEVVARIIHAQRASVNAPQGGIRDTRNATCRRIAEGLADTFAANPRFDRARFLAACGV